MNLEVRIALISSNLEANDQLRSILDQSYGDAKDEELRLKVYHSLPSVEEAVVHYAPHLIIVAIEPDQQAEKIQFLDNLRRVSTRIPIVAFAPNLDSELMLTCIKKGVRDFIREPFQATEIQEILKRLLEESPLVSQERQLGLTHTFFSYKGGVGNTFLACNAAVSLARMTNSRVLLWDMVLQNGDVSFFFDYEPNVTLTDLIQNTDKIDEPYVRATLPTHSSGVSILASPKRPEEAEDVRSEQVQALHQNLRKYFDHIVIDAGHALTDQVIGLMDNSKYVLLTTDLHLPVLKNTLRCLEVFERLGYVEDKFKIILNRYNSKYEKFDLTKAQEILRYPIAFTFLNDYFTVSRSLNTGIPVADLDKDSALSKQFDDLSRLLTTGFKRPRITRTNSVFEKLKQLFFAGDGKLEKKKPKKKEKERKEENSEKEEEEVKDRDAA